MALDVYRRKKDLPHTHASRSAALPRQLRPQLATLVDRAPDGAQWLHEIKYDGYRVLCRTEHGHATLYSRNGKDLTRRMAAVARALEALPDLGPAWLDGEVVGLDADGRTSFSALQAALSEGRDEDLVYYLFDLPYATGQNLTNEPLIARKQRLAALLRSVKPADKHVRYSDHVQGEGGRFYQEACRFGLEGIVSKRMDAPYRGSRGHNWVKTKCRLRQEFLVCGYTEPRGTRQDLGALALGVHDATGRLVYSGRAGTGFDAQTLAALRRRLEPLKISAPPFPDPLPREARKGVTWVRPETVVEVEFAGWTRDNMARQASYQGVREDKNPRDVVREVAQSLPPPDTVSAKVVKAERAATRRLTNPDKVLYPEQGLTKADLAAYYASVADWMLPHIEKRPLTLVRCPEGRHKHCFFQKHPVDAAPEFLRVPIKENKGDTEYLALDSIEGLLALVQMGVLEIHVWGSRIDKLEYPDYFVLDLDPDPALPWTAVIEAAALTRARLADLGLTGFLHTTGGKGLHVVVPLVRRQKWDEVKAFTKALAEDLVCQNPARYTARMPLAGRKGKIFIDYLRNGRGATAIANYSTRARSGAPVAVPLDWDELTPALRPTQFNVLTVYARLQSLQRDPWGDFDDARRTITVSMKRALGMRN
jgi:bifunctional non-homologous end joining protein LigD